MLKQSLDQCMQRLDKTLREIPWNKKEVYANYVAQTYYYSRHTTRLLAAVASRIPFHQESLHRRFLKHAAEETGHEKLTLNDLKFLGCDLRDFHELSSTRAFYKSQFQSIQDDGPYAFFGYILFLECLGAEKGNWLYETVAKHHGEKTVSFLKVHANEDVEHVREAFEQVQKFEAPVLEQIEKDMMMSCYLFERMILDCADLSQTQTGKKAS